MLKINLVRSYKKAEGKGGARTVFVYEVAGSPEAIAAYKKAQGDNFRESEAGAPLWFSTRCVGQNGSLITTQSGKIVADTSKFDEAASLSAQYGGNLGTEIAKHAAAQLMGNVNSSPVAVTETANLNK